MSSMIDDLLKNNIKLNHYNVGPHKTICPRCSHTRKNKKDPCLYVNITEPNLALWKCHHCFWTGGAGDVHSRKEGDDINQPKKREYKKPEAPRVEETTLPAHILKHITDRGITLEVIARNKVFYDAEKSAICFPYYAKGQLLNVKHRTLDKKFWMTAGARLTFYGLDDLIEYDKKIEDIIIVEGEYDKLALEVCGLKNVISVPNGAPAKIKEGDVIDNHGQFEYLIHGERILKEAKRVFLAVDNDKAGENLRYELSRRIGLEKCYVVTWPEGCKDANDSLQKVGTDVTCDCINDAKPYPIAGLYTVDDFQESLEQYFSGGMAAGVPTGFENLDKLYSVMPGELTVITGVPNSGKSEFLDALVTNIAKSEDWRFAIFSPENSKEQHVAKLVEKIVGVPTSPKSPQRMSLEQFMNGASWVGKYFHFIVADDGNALPTLEWVLDKAHAAVYRYGIKGLVIDPWNEIESNRPAHMQETEWVGTCLAKIKRWARANAVKVWIVAHPAKIASDKDGKTRVPGLYDIAGSANWVNKPDNGIVVYRSEEAADSTIIYVKKVRFKHVGHRGQCTLNYDKAIGRYSMPPNHPDIKDEPDSYTWDAP